MKKKERLYWEGIARANEKEKAESRTISIDGALRFLDDAYNFVRTIKGEVSLSEPTEVELYKKWSIIAKKH